MTFLSDACQPERGHFELLGSDFDHIFAQIFSLRGKKLRYTNLVDSRHIKREKASLSVDVRCSTQNALCLSSLLLLWLIFAGSPSLQKAPFLPLAPIEDAKD